MLASAARLYAVNPHATSVLGVPAVPSVAELPEPPDLAVLAVPPAQVTTVAEECGRRGAKALVVVTAEIDTVTGSQLLAACRRGGMRLVGPNCFGVAVPSIGLNATFTGTQPTAGSAGLVMQSGGIGIAVLDHLTRLGIGVSSFASVGDKYDVSSNDMLMWWEQDGSTRLAVLYVESFGSPRRFAQTARRVGRQFPVLTVIGGRSAAGQRAATSHTAAAATSLITQEALFEQAGVIATTGLGELVDTAAFFACQPMPGGSRVAIVSNAGGAGVLAADACGDNDLKVAVLSEATQRRLRKLLPSGAVVAGPVDTSAAVSRRAFRSCLELVAKDDDIDAVMAITVPTALGRLTPAILGHCDCQADRRRHAGPAGVRATATAAQKVHRAGRTRPAGTPALPCRARSLRTCSPRARPARLVTPSGTVRGGPARRARYPSWIESGTADARRLVADFLARQHGGGWLPPDQAARLLACYGISLVRTIGAASADDAVQRGRRSRSAALSC